MVVVWTTRRRQRAEARLKGKDARAGQESPLAPQPQQIRTADRLLGLIRMRNRKQAVKTRRRAVRPRGKETRADLQ
jgi:hypothetical protein